MAEPRGPEQRQEGEDKDEPLTIASEALLAGRRQLIIRHGRERYRLMLTNSNKLILTK